MEMTRTRRGRTGATAAAAAAPLSGGAGGAALGGGGTAFGGVPSGRAKRWPPTHSSPSSFVAIHHLVPERGPRAALLLFITATHVTRLFDHYTWLGRLLGKKRLSTAVWPQLLL